ncbi:MULTISPECIES: helix-turn-helix transcriptional regulator [unclassified Paenibacillus]|uniref:helix-turn-helix transcriptional regulator n=1 Tax=unclassified Paenibacillus TaxID=185978 RepID=UPI0007105D57|nr:MULTISPECIES: helix-turn-helix transcriptional regulator [unclassified Paenibacillus]KQX45417.1 hypothetical protein ASD40_21070 [Paenibacillus sp. Root444D2]KRE45762.1 hypothetical protein ASG85_06990 [Paenibacillus sp. Soil724D2]
MSSLKAFNEALKPESTSKEHVLKSTLALVFALYRFCIEKNINTNEVFGQNLAELTQVAREVFITPGYLNLLFKQELKTNFLEYLHKIRMEHACERLNNRSQKLSDIAHEVGYNDEKYFFQVFKKYMGMTPSQYRNNLDG